MSLIFTEAGVNYLVSFWPVSDDQFLHLHLFCNDVDPDKETVLADLEKPFEDTGDGRVLIDPDITFETGGRAGVRLAYPEVDIVCVGNYPFRRVYGWFLNREDGPVVCVRKFDVPILFDTDGMTLHVVPTLRVFSQLPI